VPLSIIHYSSGFARGLERVNETGIPLTRP
jgi:hypothetical protein